jgi:AraC-like DNA-binding protein
MTLINFVRTASELDWYPEKAQLQSVRSRAHTQIAGFKNSQVEYETSSTGFSFPAEWLLHPVHIHGISSNSSESNAFLDQNESEEQKFRRLLHTLVGAGGMAPTVKLTAQLLDISPRSLHRWLADQGFTYRGLLDEIRQERARDLLTGSDLSIKEIAYELGYSGPNNFIRAFKRLSGLSPGEYRERHS